ncbi:alpha/beta hydrolase [Sneathiella chinensis]|uniref:Alpha/beta hydrolase n=1 Tax=Sneathiella chinensis TaxID=349750 RepID=A0ABQ5U5Y4_9PROT|nr:alpha/beta hydrolase [Sneathiella chinensis]GLQ07549.1 alpha/beta hydrolase [Sneathiella chinensis]
MPDIIFNGPEGRLEGKYHHSSEPNAPLALILHPHPQFGGTMNNKVVYHMFTTFKNRGFSVLRFNFRGVGRSQGDYDQGVGELSDAAAALDWMQTHNENSPAVWVAGFSFGAWIAMQLLMRRPEIEGFISVAPPANMYDFSFLAPCPSSGVIIHGDKDRQVPTKDVRKLVEKLQAQKGITIHHSEVENADHFFENTIPNLMESVDDYLNMRLQGDAEK